MTPQLLGDEIRRGGASLMGFADIREFAPWPRAISIALAKVMEAEECQPEEAATILKEAIKQLQASTR
ncbi:MAG: hypothetical protein WBH57_04605 [Anaerolineae bacterium]